MSTDSGARIHDIRYRREQGERVGKAAAIWSFARWSMFRALGAGRSWKAKAGPMLLMMAALGPAVVVLGLRAIIPSQFAQNLPTEFISFRAYAAIVGIILIVFTALITPNLVCPDRADRVLSLYFATAISPRNYLIAKLAAAATAIFVIAALPQLVLLVGNVFFADDSLGYLGDHWLDVGRILAGGALMALYYAVLGVAIASLTARTAFAVGGFIGLIFGSGVLAGIVSETQGNGVGGALALGRVPITLYESLFPASGGFVDRGNDWPLGGSIVTYAVVVVISLALLIWRHRSETK